MFMRKQKVFCTFFNTCIKNGVFLYVCFYLNWNILMFFQNLSSSPSSLPSSSFSNLIFNYWTSQLDFSTLDFSKSGFSNIGFCKIGIFNIGFFPKYMLLRIFSNFVFKKLAILKNQHEQWIWWRFQPFAQGYAQGSTGPVGHQIQSKKTFCIIWSSK